MATKKTSRGRRVTGVVERKRKDGSTYFRVWFPTGVAGGKKWIPGTYDSLGAAISAREQADKLDAALPRKLVTLGMARDRVLHDYDTNGQDGTSRWYQSAMRPVVSYFGEHTPVARIVRERVAGFRDHLMARVKRGHIKVSTVLHHKRAMSITLNQCVYSRHIETNPCRGVKWPKTDAAPFEWIPSDELRANLATIRNSGVADAGMIADICELPAQTGLRRSEFAKQAIELIDLRRSRLFVGGKTRDEFIRLGAPAKEIIRRLRASRREGLLVLTERDTLSARRRRVGEMFDRGLSKVRRVEEGHADVRVRWLVQDFRLGPQSHQRIRVQSHPGHLSVSRSSNGPNHSARK